MSQSFKAVKDAWADTGSHEVREKIAACRKEEVYDASTVR
jgi:hypothetical protein